MTAKVSKAKTLDLEILEEQRLAETREWEVQIAALKSDITTLRREKNDAHKELAKLQELFETVQRIEGKHSKTPAWASPRTRKRANSGIVSLVLSDLHLDEVVDPAEVEGLNAYNREIALLRLKRCIEKTIFLSRDYVSGLKYDGAVLFLGGDIVSGFIHEELTETNEGTMPETVVYWLNPLSAAIGALVEEYGKLHIAGVVGNHGRLSRKPRAKRRVVDNFDWLIYRLLMRDFANDSRVTWQIPHSADTTVKIYNTNFLFTHGDQFRGGSGVSGLLAPLMTGAYRKAKRGMQTDRSFDYMVMGHWHNYAAFKNIIVNGCFTADTLVQTDAGPTRIAEVAASDLVLSTDGTMQKVKNVFTKTSDEGLVTLKVSGLPVALEVTPNHLIWAIKTESLQTTPKYRNQIMGGDQPQWIPADFISPNDWVNVPVMKGNERPCTPELAWAFGLFLAEGHVLLDGGSTKKHHRIEFSMHIDELGILQEAKGILDPFLEKEGRLWTRSDRTTSHLTYTVSRETAVEWRSWFGHRAQGKQIPSWLMSCSPDLAEQLVRGWVDGDGCVVPQPDCRDTRSATTVSQRLAYGMFQMALRSGQYPSMALLAAGGPRKSDTYTIHFNAGQDVKTVNGELFYRVKYRFRNQKVLEVFDLEVGGEHTYNAGLVGVHNSTKGYDEYAYTSNFEFEPPQQAFWVTTPEHGMTFSAPVLVRDEKNEVW